MTCILRSGSLRELGGKAFALARLTAADINVPEWFVVAPAAFMRSLACEQRELLASGCLDAAALASLRPAPDVAAEIDAALCTIANLGARFAVRSSAIDEDSAESSFAGQLESYLFVDRPSVLDRIADVWRSGFSDRLLKYRRQRGLSPLPSPPAVLVQRMIDADCAGVAFSADPVSGRCGLAVVSAVYGIGTALVGGDTDADTWAIDRDGRIERRTVAVKTICHRFDDKSPQNISALSIPEDRQRQPVLSDDHVLSVATLARAAESVFGLPQDIEWAIQGGALCLLQSRPITTLRALPDPDGALNLWDNSNIVESYSGVTTPLTFSFARSSYESVYRQFCRILRVPERTLAANDRIFGNMLGLIRGRIYYNLLNWYRALALLPGFTVNRRFMEQMMGVRESVPDEALGAKKTATSRDRLADSVHVAAMLIGLAWNYVTLKAQIRRFNARLATALAEPAPPLALMRLDELTAHFEALQRELGSRWDAPLSNDFFAMIFHGVLRKLTLAWCGDSSGMLANAAIRGGGGMISAEPAARVREMAAIAAQDPDLVRALCEAPVPDAVRAIHQNLDFRALYDAYLTKFGDRCLEELKLESETLHENPAVLLRSIGELARTAQTSPQPAAPPPAADAWQTVRRKLQGSPFRQLLMHWVLRNARNRVRQRENLRFERTRLFGRMRRIFLEAGKRLHALGALDDPRDIFYLETDEVVALVAGTAVTTDIRSLTALRKAEFDLYRSAPSPAERFETRGVVYIAQSYQRSAPPAAAEASGEDRRGIGCCPGIVRGAVRVIRDPRNAQLQAGSILVADHTDPGWIMLFPSAAGLLVERGSLLSHSAIVARELGIPAVVSIPGLTAWLRDGDLVELDGAQGTVRRLFAEEHRA
ncbi:MAG TPA: PEP/pyruvate-binding domain-containing protein [Acidobacteriaceae bacterium]|nr:PEP/pyruvate-binding domain-containing protein [Acidobacteriaceae bacterium]